VLGIPNHACRRTFGSSRRGGRVCAADWRRRSFSDQRRSPGGWGRYPPGRGRYRLSIFGQFGRALPRGTSGRHSPRPLSPLGRGGPLVGALRWAHRRRVGSLRQILEALVAPDRPRGIIVARKLSVAPREWGVYIDARAGLALRRSVQFLSCPGPVGRLSTADADAGGAQSRRAGAGPRFGGVQSSRVRSRAL